MVTNRVNSDVHFNTPSSFLGKATVSILTGLCGTVLIVVVITGVLPLGQIVGYLPWILGFNAAVSGYTFLDRKDLAIRHEKAAGAVIGILVGVVSCALLHLMTLQMTGIGLMHWSEMAVSIGFATVFGFSGAWLAVAHSRLKATTK